MEAAGIKVADIAQRAGYDAAVGVERVTKILLPEGEKVARSAG